MGELGVSGFMLSTDVSPRVVIAVKESVAVVAAIDK
jgi:hypothetical protein